MIKLLGNDYFFYFSKVVLYIYYINLLKTMRKRPAAPPHGNKQNRYDQITNLGIDLQSQVNKSIIFPKITAKIADYQLRQFVNRRKQQQEQTLHSIRGEVQKLRRHLYRLDQKKHQLSHLKTEQNQRNYQIYSHCPSKHVNSNCMFDPLPVRNSVDYAEEWRQQRNTQNIPRSIHRDTSYHTILDRKYEGQLESVLVQKSVEKLPAKPSSIPSIPFCSSSSTILEKKVIKVKQKKHKPNKIARNRLRAAIMAVYFTIFLPSFSRKIYLNKLKNFMSEYPHEITKYYLGKKEQISKYKQDQAQVWQELQERFNFMEAVQKANLTTCLKDRNQIRQIKVHFQFLMNEQLNSSQKYVQQTYQQQIMHPKNVQFLLNNLQNIVGKILDDFTDFIKTPNLFATHWKTLSQGILNNSFVNNSHPKLLGRIIQSGMIRLHPFKQLLLVYDQQTEIGLLTFDILCRVYCYKWLCRLQKAKLDKTYSQKSILIGSFLLTVFYIAGEMIIDQKIKAYVKQKLKFDDKQKGRNQKIRPIVPLMIKRKVKNDLKATKRLIYDPPMVNQVSQVVITNKEVISKIQEKMLNAGTELYYKLKEHTKLEAINLKQSSLKEKFIIQNDKQRPQNCQKYQSIDNEKTNNIGIQNKTRQSQKSKILLNTSKQKDYNK